jgi:hypothetical protein
MIMLIPVTRANASLHVHLLESGKPTCGAIFANASFDARTEKCLVITMAGLV